MPEHEKRQGEYEELAKQVQRTVDMEGASLLPRRVRLPPVQSPVERDGEPQEQDERYHDHNRCYAVGDGDPYGGAELRQEEGK